MRIMSLRGRCLHAQRHQQDRKEAQQAQGERTHPADIGCRRGGLNRTDHISTIQTAIPIIIRFSVSEMKPSGTLLDPPTQAHFSSRLSI